MAFSKKLIITDNLEAHFEDAREGIERHQDFLIKDGHIGNNEKKKMRKTASGVSISAPVSYNPLYSPTSMQLPRDRKTTYYWCRHFYETEPYVAGCIDLYAQLSVNKFFIECEDPAVEDFFRDMCEKIDLFKVLKNIAFEYWKIGDVFPMCEFDEEESIWKRIVLLNPDFVDVKRHAIMNDPSIELIPDDELKRICFERTPADIYHEMIETMPELVDCVRKNKNISIDNTIISHLRHAPTPYAIFGTPFLKRVFKSLMYRDMLRTAQFTIAQRYVYPMKIFKMGTEDELPAQEEIDEMQERLTALMNNPNLVLVTHARLNADWQGTSGKILALNSEYETMENEMLAGLGVNKAFLAGEGPTYNNASIGGEAFVKRLESFREELRWWVENKVFKPIAELHAFVGKNRQILVPTFRWDRIELRDEIQKQRTFIELREKGIVSAQTLLETFRIDVEVEKQRIEEERGGVFDPIEIVKRIGGGEGSGPLGSMAPKPASPGPGRPPKEEDKAASNIMDLRVTYRNLKKIRKKIAALVSQL